MFSQSMSMHMDYSENFNDNTRFISSDYSPFVTDDNYIIETSINDEFTNNDNINNLLKNYDIILSENIICGYYKNINKLVNSFSNLIYLKIEN